MTEQNKKAAEEKAAAEAAAKAEAEAEKKAEDEKAAAEAKTSSLATYVHVDGVVYGPDSKVPAEVAKQITNPKAWA